MAATMEGEVAVSSAGAGVAIIKPGTAPPAQAPINSTTAKSSQ